VKEEEKGGGKKEIELKVKVKTLEVR